MNKSGIIYYWQSKQINKNGSKKVESSKMFNLNQKDLMIQMIADGRLSDLVELNFHTEMIN
jgi:hypothetical protein